MQLSTINGVARLFLVAVVMSSGLAGCGGGGGGGASPTTTTNSTATTTTTTTTTTATVPSSPTISATAGDTQVTLSWPAVSGATSYNVYWGTSSGVTTASGNEVVSVNSPYTHTGLSNGTTYYYIVTAVNSVGESTASPEVSATPNPPPPGWSGAATLDSLDVTGSLARVSPVAASINSTGTGMALWLEGDTACDLYAAIYQNGVWEPSFLFSSLSNDASVTVAPSGDAIVVYVQQVWDSTLSFNSSQAIYSQRYNHLTGAWTAPELIGGDPTTGYAYNPKVTSDSNGNAMAIWVDPSSQIFARRYDATLGAWEATAVQLSNSPRSVANPMIVVDSNGVFTAAWIEDSAAYDPSLSAGGPNHRSPMVRRYVAGSWGTSYQNISWPTTSYLGSLDGAGSMWMDANAAGNIAVVWEQSTTLADGSVQESIDTALFDPVAGTWSSSPSHIFASTSLWLSWPQVAIDGNGNAIATWEQQDPTLSTIIATAQSSSYTAAANSWSAPLQIDQNNGDDVGLISIGMDGNGNAEAVWEDNTSGGVIERRYDATGGTGWGAFNKRNAAWSPLLDMSDGGYAILLGHSQVWYSTAIYDDAAAYVLTP
jgi:hypothetical protein